MKDELNGDFRETELGALPAEWDIVSLSQVTEKTKQSNPRRNPTSRFKYVDVSSVSNENLKITDSADYVGTDAPGRARKVIKKNDVIFATVRPYLKRVALVPESLDGQICSTAFCVIRCNSNLADARFVFFAATADEFVQRVVEHQRGSSYPAVTDKNVLDEIIALPPLPEQRAIARVLSTIQRAIETQDKLIAAARELKKSLMRQLFTQGLDANGAVKETEIGVMPEHWQVTMLGELLDRKVLFARNGFPCGNHNDKGAGIPHLRPFNIDNDGRIALNTIKYIETNVDIKKYLLEQGDVIFNNTNSEKLVGKTGYWQSQGKFVLSNHMTILRILQDEVIDGIYLSKFLQKRWEDGYFTGICRRHVNQASISLARLHQIAIALPQPPEQRAIARILSTADKKIENEEKRKAALEALFKTMLQQLMTGKLRMSIPDPFVKTTDREK